ncbi:MAG: ExeM/NucH family extracellular endonuclease, partial [Frankiales bacterium]|nr:ExeM/NucH family extracellular endonuclease [Frankiales bacterium]
EVGSALVQFLSYEGDFTATNGPASGTRSTDIGVKEAGTEPIGQSLQLTGTGSTYRDFSWSGPARSSRDSLNSNQTLNGSSGPPAATPGKADCGAAASALTPISAVQGAGSATPIPADRSVQVEGVVVGDLDDMEPGGFFLQSETPDDDSATSEGLFVANPATRTVTLGQRVRAAGLVAERNGLTTLVADDVAVCASGVTRPAAAELPLPSDDITRERFEGMRVAVTSTLTLTEQFNLDRFGEVVLSANGVQIQPTEIAQPGSATATATITANSLNRITLDDGRGASDLRPVPYLRSTVPVRLGDRATLEDVVLSFGFGTFRLQPSDGDARNAGSTTFVETNPRPARPADVGGTYKVGAFNVLNYFTTLSSQDPRARGASNATDFQKQEAKIVAAINLLGADVVALQEIENSAALGEQTDEALASLVAALNGAAGAGSWAFVPSSTDLPAAAQQDVITNAIIYKPARVTRVGRSRSITDEENFDNAREPVAQTFSASGDVFTVIANHLKSKGGTGTGANADTGQGSFTADRVGQARAVLSFAEQLRSETGDSDVINLGDFNAYTQEDPVEVLRRGGFRDLVETGKPGDYSYVFNGLSGSLDHALASISLSQKVTGVDVWNINSPESEAYQYNGVPDLYTADQYRSSDHDPVVVGLDLGVKTQAPYDVQVLGINDFHGRLQPPVSARGTAPSRGGAAFLADAVNVFRAEIRNTVMVSAGDNIGATPFASAVQQDAPALAALDAMGLEVTSVGNHEFDRGYADLAGRVANLAGFPFLGANVVGEEPQL